MFLTAADATDQDSNDTGKASVDEIAVYSFALKPEEHQPSGTCNFSRIDNSQLKMADNANEKMYTPSTTTYSVSCRVWVVSLTLTKQEYLAYSN